MARQPRRRHSHQVHDPDNLDRWLVSYADFITLLFAFFVVMYAISSVNEGKYRVFGASLTEAFGGHGQAKVVDKAALGDNEKLLKSLVERRDARLLAKLRKQQQAMQVIAHNINQVMASLVASKQVSVYKSRRGMVLDINASALFNQGEAELQNASWATLSEVAVILATAKQAIEIEGYTDNVPINTPRFPSNWELSSARAGSVARLFIQYGVTAQRLTVVGSAANHPIASNDTAEGKARNRRITVTLLSPATEKPTHSPQK